MKMSETEIIVKVGSRKSQLAMVQTENVIEKLKSKHPHVSFEIVGLSTVGDKVLNKSLAQIGQTSLFLKELEVALLDKKVDIVVHSLKDVPTDLPAGLVIGAVCEREVCGDALVVKKGSAATSLETLPKGSVVGTSSARRTAQLGRSFPHLKIVDVRGNLNTRLSKLDEEGGPYDALVLAAAGLVRLGWHGRITQVLDSGEVMYAVGQGAIGVECRQEDRKLLQLLSHLTHHDTLLACIAERSFLHKLQGGCSLPVSVLSSLNGKQLSLKGGVLSVDGKKEVQGSLKIDFHDSTHQCSKDFHFITSVFIENPALEESLQAEKLGIDLAEMLLREGASELLKEARSVSDKIAAVELKD